MFTNNISSVKCDGWHGGSEIIGSAIESWIKKDNTSPLIIFFDNGTSCRLSPSANNKTNDELTISVEVHQPDQS